MVSFVHWYIECMHVFLVQLSLLSVSVLRYHLRHGNAATSVHGNLALKQNIMTTRIKRPDNGNSRFGVSIRSQQRGLD